MKFNIEIKNYLMALAVLLLSLSYIIFYSKFVDNYEYVAINSITDQTDGTRVTVTGVIDSMEENGFYVCEYDDCIKVTGDYEGILYPGDRVTVRGTVASYKGYKFIMINRLSLG